MLYSLALCERFTANMAKKITTGCLKKTNYRLKNGKQALWMW